MKGGLLVRRLQLFKGKREGVIEAWPETDGKLLLIIRMGNTKFSN